MADKDDDIIAEISEFRSESEGYWSEVWQEYKDDIDFSRMGKQWPEQQAKQREIDGRPCLTFNKLPSFMRQVTNEARMNKPAIVIKPMDDKADVETAKIINGMIRAIESSSKSDQAYDTAIDNTVAGGLGYIFVTTDYADDLTFEQDIMIKRCTNPLMVKFDPSSIEPDGSDAMRCLVEEKVSTAVYKIRYKSYSIDGVPAEYKDDDGVTICHYWKVDLIDDELLLMSDGSAILKSELDGDEELQLYYDSTGVTATDKSRKVQRRQVTQYTTNGAKIIKTTEWAGKYIPVIPVYGEEVWDGDKRHYKSLHRDSHDAARMYNYFRTATAESVALQTRAPWVGRIGTFDTDIGKWSTANTENHAFIEYDGDVPPSRQGWVGVDTGSLQEAMNASEDMKAIMGIYDASLGNRSNETSGIAIAQRKSQAGVSTYHFTDNLARSIAQVGRVIVDLIPKIYDTPRMTRILGEDGKKEEAVLINAPTEYNGRSAMFDVRSGRYDVTVDTGASFTTRREEIAAQITEIIRSYPEGAPLVMDVLAENSDWPKADKVAKRFAAMLPEQIQAAEQEGEPLDPMQLQQQLQQSGQQLQQAEEAIEQLKSMLAEQQQQAEMSESAIQLELEREKNKGKYLDLQKQKQITDSKQAELLTNQIPVIAGDGGLTY
jgi:hypothetical protein